MSEIKCLSAKSRFLLMSMMFFQFMMLAVWFVPLAAYLENLGIRGIYRALILSSMALGCLASPIVGMIADRYFAGQKMLAVLNLVGGILLLGAAYATRPIIILVLLPIQMLCYMPTWGLTSAIAMTHAPADKFPQIRVFGSIGWVASGLCSLLAIHLFGIASFDGTNLPMYCGAGISFVAAAFAIVLPATPPPANGQKASIGDALGLRAFVLMKDLHFAMFIITSFLVMVPFAAYWSYGSAFLHDEGFKYITVAMNWGQAAEMLFMLLVPVALSKLGVRWTLALGLAALVLRYAMFLAGTEFGMDSLYFLAILVHGLIFGFFFVGGQIYIDRQAPPQIRAQAQGAFFLVTFGVGLILGNFVNEWLIQRYSSNSVTDWRPVWLILTIVSAALLCMFATVFREPRTHEDVTMTVVDL